MNNFFENQLKPKIPEGYNFLVWLSHDVDRVKKHWFHYLNDFRKHKKIKAIVEYFNKKNSYWNFDNILNIEEKYGVKSTFFLLNESIKFNLFNPKTFYLAKGRYKFRDNDIKNIIREIDKSGWEIGLHGSYNSYADKELLREEKDKLEIITGKRLKGIRQHYLNLNIPNTWEYQMELGFEYDGSYGSTNAIGFKNNILYPFSPIKDFTVIPLTLMEVHLLSDDNNPFEKIDQLIKLCIQKKNIFSVLWHPHFINEQEFPIFYELYEYLIKKCIENKGYFILPGYDKFFLNLGS